MKNISLVISSGGARGFAAIGVIEELEKHGYKIKSVAGCSIGSLITGMYASGNLPKFKNWILKLNKKDVFRLMDFTISTQGFLKGEKIFNEIKNTFTDVKIENLKIPFSAVAVDLVSHEEIIFRKGSLFEAIRASCSIPSVVKPVKQGNKILVDGGIINPLPFSIIKRQKNDFLVGVDVNSFDAKNTQSSSNYFGDYYKYIETISNYLPLFLKDYIKKSNKEIGGYMDITSRSFQIMQEKIVQNSIDKNKPDLVFKIPRDSCNMFNFLQAKELIKIGRRIAVSQIPALDTKA